MSEILFAPKLNVKASAHSYKRFTSRLLKLSFSLSLSNSYMYKGVIIIQFEPT